MSWAAARPGHPPKKTRPIENVAARVAPPVANQPQKSAGGNGKFLASGGLIHPFTPNLRLDFESKQGQEREGPSFKCPFLHNNDFHHSGGFSNRW
jgi:hypothetical protein